ncbi:MAG: hypothetical protein Ct9H300mP8_10470 [Gammaproteobacteria bacterium]|nr:MAG: hypothetical protein Ct9H300mP8_10470 [Gammaproteobacteria bacterium]
MGARVVAATEANDTVEVVYQDKDGDQNISVEKLIVAVGSGPTPRIFSRKIAELAWTSVAFYT